MKFVYNKCLCTTLSFFTYCAFYSLWEEKSLVDGVDSVIGFNITLSLQQDGTSIQSVISPEHCKPALFVTVDQCPVKTDTGSEIKQLSLCLASLQLDLMNITYQLIAEAPLWRGSRDGW